MNGAPKIDRDHSSNAHDAQSPRTQLHVYVIHSTKLAGRMPAINKLRETLSRSLSTPSSSSSLELASFEIVSDNDASKLKELSNDEVSRIADVKANDLKPPYDKMVTPIHLNQLSNAMNHMTALRRIETRTINATTDPVHESAEKEKTQENSRDVNLVVEDDVVYNEEALVSLLWRTLSSAPDAWDVIFLGLPSTMKHEEGEQETSVKYQQTSEVFRVLPACDSYLVTSKAAKHLAANFLPVRFATHVHLSWLLSGGRPILNGSRPQQQQRAPLLLRSYVVSPNVFLDGSKMGVYTSSINVNNRLLWNPWYIKLGRLVRRQGDARKAGESSEVLRSLEREVDEMYRTMHFKQHPDIVYMYALSLERRGAFREAQALMAEAYRLYEANECVMNRSSEFLKAFCDLYRHLQ